MCSPSPTYFTCLNWSTCFFIVVRSITHIVASVCSLQKLSFTYVVVPSFVPSLVGIIRVIVRRWVLFVGSFVGSFARRWKGAPSRRGVGRQRILRALPPPWRELVQLWTNAEKLNQRNNKATPPSIHLSIYLSIYLFTNHGWLAMH